MVTGVAETVNTNASRMCFPNGTWQNRSDYSHCLPLDVGMAELDIMHNYAQLVIYYVGFSVSMIALLISLFIFLYFRSLMCVRNRIHCHLIVTFLLRYTIWFVMNVMLPTLDEMSERSLTHQWVCRMTVTVHRYFQMTNFFWMLVEGLYLHTVIVWAFSIERVKFWYYAVLGWCVPGVFVIIWAVVKSQEEVSAQNLCWLPGNEPSPVEWIYITPILGVLLINIIFMCSIIWVLVTKLRASNTLQTRLYSLGHNYRKAVKATTILLPLLGITYVLMITPPGKNKVSSFIFVYFNALLQSTQGFTVAVCYCFLNGEVRSTIAQRFERWQEERSIATRYTMTRASIATTAGAAEGPTVIVPDGKSNGRLPPTAPGDRDYLKNNNTNGVNHMMTVPMLSVNDEVL